MAKKLKKMLNYWFNPENYSIIKSINGIIDTVNELIDGGGGGGGYTLPIASTTTLGGVKVDGTTITANGDGVISAIGGGGGSVATLNWTKVDTTVAIPVLVDIGGGFKMWNLSTNNFNIQGNHKGLMLESDYFEASDGDLAQNNSLGFSVLFSDGHSITLGNAKATTAAQLNRVRVYAVKNPITGLYEMGFCTTVETRRNNSVMETDTPNIDRPIFNPIVPIKSDKEISSLSIVSTIMTATGAFATQGGVTFSLYVAD